MSQEIHDNDDTYSKLNSDTLFLIDRLRIIKAKKRDTSWYRIGTHIKLRNELSDIVEETDKIGERLNRLEMERKNPIKIVKRQ